ncbi:hypothetical protein Tco_1466056 [Tanacetum coccineum]
MTIKFADSHNMVAFLTKSAESEGFEQIVDFLNANPIRYALTINPTIYASCIKQFWATVKMKTVNGEVHQSSDPTNVADEAVNEEPRITLDSTHFDADIDMFGVHDLDGDEVVVESEVAAKKKDDEVNVVKEVVSATEETVNAATILKLK